MSVEVPYVRHGSKAWERHFKSMRKKYPKYSVYGVANLGEEPWIAPQIIAEARSRVVAQKAFELLSTAMTIRDGSNTFSFDDAVVVPRDRRQLEDLSESNIADASHYIFSRGNVAFASRFAAALSRRRSLCYAAFKLKLSYDVATTHWMNLHPRYSPKEFGVSKSLSDHVRMASAIMLAYSALEELQLEPRPMDQKPVKSEAGWDPTALADLQKRLRKAHVDLSQPETWTRRGSQTRIHKSKRAAAGDKLSWTKGVVRDRSVKVEDALLEASWLRSKCSTHKYQKATQSLSMYDVSNVQMLARRLLLESTGLWRDMLSAART